MQQPQLLPSLHFVAQTLQHLSINADLISKRHFSALQFLTIVVKNVIEKLECSTIQNYEKSSFFFSQIFFPHCDIINKKE